MAETRPNGEKTVARFTVRAVPSHRALASAGATKAIGVGSGSKREKCGNTTDLACTSTPVNHTFVISMGLLFPMVHLGKECNSGVTRPVPDPVQTRAVRLFPTPPKGALPCALMSVVHSGLEPSAGGRQ